jgi:magnesium chelatase family protein
LVYLCHLIGKYWNRKEVILKGIVPVIWDYYTCGYDGDGSGRCRCRPEQIKRYQDKLSGPLLDRIDLHITVPALPIADLQNAQAGETSEQVRTRVAAAHERQLKRQKKVNNELSPNEIDKYIHLGEAEQQLL